MRTGDGVALRKRPDDIPLLAEHFLRKYNQETARQIRGFTHEALDALVHYRWPGNVRELRNAVERKAILSILLEQVTQLMEAQSAAVDTLVGPEELFVELGVGIWQPYEGVRFALSEGISGRVIASREPFLDHGGAQFDATPHEMRDIPALPAVACVPLIADGEALGTLWIAREQTISEDSVHMLQALADIGASALRRATLYQQAQRRADQLKAVHSLGRSLAHLLKAEDIYARLV